MRAAAGAASLALAALACRGPAPAPTTPEAAALAAFTPAGSSLVPAGDAGAALALRGLAEARDARAVGTAQLPEAVVAVDVEASLGGGSRARYAIHVARGEDGSFRIVSIGGPGIAWPERSRPPGEGLSESAPPR